MPLWQRHRRRRHNCISMCVTTPTLQVGLRQGPCSLSRCVLKLDLAVCFSRSVGACLLCDAILLKRNVCRAAGPVVATGGGWMPGRHTECGAGAGSVEPVGPAGHGNLRLGGPADAGVGRRMHGQQRVALQRMLACLLAAAPPRRALHPAQCVTGTCACKCDSTNGKTDNLL